MHITTAQESNPDLLRQNKYKEEFQKQYFEQIPGPSYAINQAFLFVDHWKPLVHVSLMLLFLFSTFSAFSFASGSILSRVPNVRIKSIWYVINILVWLSLMCHFFRNANSGIWDSMIAWDWEQLKEEQLCFLASPNDNI